MMCNATQSAAERRSLAQTVQTEADSVSFPLRLLFNALCSQNESQTPRASGHASRERHGQCVDQVFPGAGQDITGKYHTCQQIIRELWIDPVLYGCMMLGNTDIVMFCRKELKSMMMMIECKCMKY